MKLSELTIGQLNRAIELRTQIDVCTEELKRLGDPNATVAIPGWTDKHPASAWSGQRNKPHWTQTPAGKRKMRRIQLKRWRTA